jgi:hypothetical protein
LRVAEARELRVERPGPRRQRELELRARCVEVAKLQILFLELDELDFFGLRRRGAIEEVGDAVLGPENLGIHVLELRAGRKCRRHLPPERLEALRLGRDVGKGNRGGRSWSWRGGRRRARGRGDEGGAGLGSGLFPRSARGDRRGGADEKKDPRPAAHEPIHPRTRSST